MKQARHSWTKLGIVTALVCSSLGLAYGVLCVSKDPWIQCSLELLGEVCLITSSLLMFFAMLFLYFKFTFSR